MQYALQVYRKMSTARKICIKITRQLCDDDGYDDDDDDEHIEMIMTHYCR